jgi:hypothetical protein
VKRILLIAVAVLVATGALAGQSANKKPPVKAQNTTKGQGQLQGGDGVFKTIYTLDNGFNFTILSARYSVEPFNTYEDETVATDEKFLILTVAVKNANAEDAFFNGDHAPFTAVDEKGANHDGSNYRLASLGIKGFSPTMKPGQGYGQDPAADELTVAIKVPADVRISKIILNTGRKFVPGEKVVRYFVAGTAKKDRDGADGNPKNVIAPLPDYLRDPTDPTGAVALAEGRAKIGMAASTGYWSMTCDSATTSTTEKLNDAAPEDGKQFVIASFTVKNIYGKELSLFEAVGSDGVPLLKDADGEKYGPVPDSGARKAKRDEQADSSMVLQPGETYSFRWYFQIPKDAKPKTLVFGQPSGHHYALEVPAAK